jgi:hypothetical protein
MLAMRRRYIDSRLQLASLRLEFRTLSFITLDGLYELLHFRIDRSHPCGMCIEHTTL